MLAVLILLKPVPLYADIVWMAAPASFPGFLGRRQALNAKGSSLPSKDLCYLVLPHPGPLPTSPLGIPRTFCSPLASSAERKEQRFEVRENKCHNPPLVVIKETSVIHMKQLGLTPPAPPVCEEFATK